MLSSPIALMIVVSYPYFLNGFSPTGQMNLFDNIPQFRSPSTQDMGTSITKLEKHQGIMNRTLTNLTALVKQLQGKTKTDKEAWTTKEEDLTSLVNQAMAKISALQSNTSKESSALRSQIERIRDDVEGLKEMLANISSEVKTMTTTFHANENKETSGSSGYGGGETGGNNGYGGGETGGNNGYSGGETGGNNGQESEETGENISGGKQETPDTGYDGKISPDCPVSKGYTQLTSRLCIRLSDKSDSQNWYDSRDACNHEGGELVTFHTLEEQEKVMKFYNDMKEAAYDADRDYMRPWIGMDRKQYRYIWLDHSTFAGKWGPYQPKNTSVFKCVALTMDGMYDSSCYITHRFVCQMKLATSGSR